MTELLTAAQMRAIEQAAIESGEVTGLELMERAGRGVVEAIFEEWPELAKTDHRAVVLCGPGNNGGDGFVVARLLKEWGWEVEVFLYGETDKLPADARVNYERWLVLGAVNPWRTDDVVSIVEWRMDGIVVDALFGTGLTRPISHELRALWKAYMISTWEEGASRFVAVDIPSGICADSGKGIGLEFSANLTVTFHAAKIGHIHNAGMCGNLRVIDIGLKPSPHAIWVKNTASNAWQIEKRNQGIPHKYTHGHALILSGPSTKTGATRLAARGALRIGAGLVTVAATNEALAEHAAQLNAMMLVKAEGAGDFAKIIKDERINALCVGPAFGMTNDRTKLLKAVLKTKRATVIDADALTLVSKSRVLFKLLHNQCVLTPHDGEFGRLFPDIAKKLNATPTKGPAYSKVDATREAAKRASCVVLFKGPDTVIAHPDGRCAINSAHYDRAAPWLATAGSGDVLAGFITGLMARGFAPMQAAETAAWLHVECALKFGPGLIAEDLPEQLPKVFQDLGL